MEAFLSQNVVWIVLLAVGAMFVVNRMHGGHRGFFGGERIGGHGLLGGGHDAHGGGWDAGRAEVNRGDGGQARGVAPATIDPVSRNPVDPARALSSVYGGRVYYFESAETRTKFEAAPSSYASGQPEQQQPSRRRHGC